MEEKLAAATAAQKETGKTIEKLMEQIPAMEKELAALKSNTTQQGSALTAKVRTFRPWRSNCRNGNSG